METKPYKNRWFLAINGIIAILFGLLLLLFTQKTILSVVFFSGLVMVLGGLCFLLIAIYQLRKDRNVMMLIFQSIFSIAIGLIIMIFKEQSLHLFLILLGVWAIIVGIFQLTYFDKRQKEYFEQECHSIQWTAYHYPGYCTDR